jgi:hypothetical protein
MRWRQPGPRAQRVEPKRDRKTDSESFPADNGAEEDTSESTDPGQLLDGPPYQPCMQASRRHTSSSNYESRPTKQPGYPPLKPPISPPERGPF